MSTTQDCEDPTAAALLGVLRSPTRNRYFYGKMLDAHHCRLEQDYVNQMRWLMNRLSLGTGVLCGLQVKINSEKHMAQIVPGVAVDGLGREIIVPTPSAQFDFVAMGDAAAASTAATRTRGAPDDAHALEHEGHGPFAAAAAADPQPSGYTVFLCYHECCVEPVPVMVTDECAPERRCEHGLIRERYCVKVTRGLIQMPPLNGFPELCEPLFHAKNMTRQRRQELLCRVRPPLRHRNDNGRLVRSGDCKPPDEICVPIAGIVKKGDGWAVLPCPPPRLLFSNEVLFEMIMCLADCCQGRDEPPVEHDFPRVVALQPAPGRTYTRDSDPELFKAWAERKQNDGWFFNVRFNHQMNAADVGQDPATWLRVFLAWSAIPRTDTVAVMPPEANIVRMGVAVVQQQHAVGQEFEVRYRITLPNRDQLQGHATAEQTEFILRLANGIPVGPASRGQFRFIVLMHTEGQHPIDAGSLLLDARCDGVGDFDQPQGGNPAAREMVFALGPIGTGLELPRDLVLGPLPASIETPPTPGEQVTESWFSAVLDFEDDF